VFLWLRAAGGRRLSAWLGERAGRWGWTLLFAVPIALVPLTVLPPRPKAEDWGTFVYLFGFFAAGDVLMSDPQLMEAVRRDFVPALQVAVGVDAAILVSGVPDSWTGAGRALVQASAVVGPQPAWPRCSDGDFITGDGCASQGFNRHLRMPNTTVSSHASGGELR
jgi:hypothetical protein